MRKIDVERIKADNPIESVVARYVDLKRRGRVLVGLCPFHQERDPSFTVWPDGGWYCFGCGEGGDVIDFVMKIENVDFKEACEILGGGGLPPLRTPPPKASAAPVHRTTLGRRERQALGLALRVYHARLWSLPPDSAPRRYLERRKLSPEAVRRFGIGWCTGKDLEPAMQFLRMDSRVFQEIGLLHDDGREMMRGRIVLPDRAPGGEVVHMVGRALGNREPRYMALPGLPKPIYGLETVRRQEPVAVVEGIFCRISLETHGVQAVAVMGTALRGTRAERLKAVPRLYFIPDNDPSGRKAAQEWREAVGHGEIVELPDGVKDVNDLDQAGGLEAWLESWADWR